MVVIIYVSAAIRLGQAAAPPLDAGMLTLLRGVHRAAASLEVVAALLLAWLAWRARAAQRPVAYGAALVLTLTIALSVLGIAAGQAPPPAAALGNLLGGLALAAAFAWLLGRLTGRATWSGDGYALLPIAALLAAQCLLGASLATLPRTWVSAAVPAHGILGIVFAALVFRLARRAVSPVRRATGVVLACAVPLAGFSVLHFETAAAAFVHAAVAALLVIAAAYSRFRPA